MHSVRQKISHGAGLEPATGGTATRRNQGAPRGRVAGVTGTTPSGSSQGGVRGIDAFQSSVTGTLLGDFGDSGVRRTARTRSDASQLVSEDSGEAVGDVRATVVASWHRKLAGVTLPAIYLSMGV